MAGRRRQSESDAKSASSATKELTLMPFLIPLLLNEAIAKPGRVWPRRGVALPNCGRAGRVTLPGGMRGAPAAGARTRQARQSAFADAKGRVAAHLRASSKRVAPLFRPFGPDAPAGHEPPLSRDTNFLALHLSVDFASQEQNGLVVFAQRGWRFASQEQNGLVVFAQRGWRFASQEQMVL